MKLAKPFAMSAEKGAESLIFLASAPELAAVPGEYFHECHITPTAAAAQDNTVGERLWLESAQLTNGTLYAKGKAARRAQAALKFRERWARNGTWLRTSTVACIQMQQLSIRKSIAIFSAQMPCGMSGQILPGFSATLT